MRQLLLRNEAATSEIIPVHLYEDQVDFHVVYIASCIPSEIRRIKLPFALQYARCSYGRHVHAGKRLAYWWDGA
jgi:hypothetical protein